MLKIPVLKVDGRYWAGRLSPHNYRLSPINGKMAGLPKTTIFTGTREIFYPDELQLTRKLQRNAVPVTLHVGHNLNHVYPVYPTPEASRAQQQIIKLLK